MYSPEQDPYGNVGSIYSSWLWNDYVLCVKIKKTPTISIAYKRIHISVSRMKKQELTKDIHLVLDIF